jgi:Ca2+-binding EF-hand superfamily protein
MHFAGNRLFLGQRSTLGLWSIPVSEIEATVAGQKKLLLAKQAQDVGAMEQKWKDLLAKYDRNHSGAIDPDEREAALDDAAFIAAELDLIDTNHNGWLEPEELFFFDPNQNKTLEPKEQAGIELAQHLLAEKLLKQFDADGDGRLDRLEFNDLVAENRRTRDPAMSPVRGFPDANHDGHVDLGELETFLHQQISWDVRARTIHVPGLDRRATPGAPAADPRILFKEEVEKYWQKPVASASANLSKPSDAPRATAIESTHVEKP